MNGVKGRERKDETKWKLFLSLKRNGAMAISLRTRWTYKRAYEWFGSWFDRKVFNTIDP